jgi:hypothetical protein
MLLKSNAVNTLADQVVLMRGDEVIFGALQSDQFGDRLELNLNQIVDDYRYEPDHYFESLREYLRSHRRNLLKESFEVVKAYAIATAQMPQFKGLPCYMFARFIRNSISHDLHFRFRPAELPLLPVAYGGVTLDVALQNQPMKEGHLSPFLAFKIHAELVQFVESH